MSYIRSTSNPEGIYIWSNDEDVEILVGSTNSNNPYTVPESIFNDLLMKYVLNGQEDCSVGGLKIEEVWVKVNGDEIIEIPENELDENKIDGTNQLRMKLSYNDWKVLMWDVTWNSIAYINYKRYNKKW